MSKLNKLVSAILVSAGMITLNSCKKEIVTTNVTFINPTETNKVAKHLLDFALPFGNSSLSFKNGAFDCAIVTIDSSNSTHVKTFDYGTGCADENGIVRKGLVMVSYNSENVQIPGTLITFSFSNFFINNDEVTGGINVENTGLNGNGNMVIHFSANCQDISPVNGPTQLDADQYLEWTTGSNTPAYDDDVFSMTGYYSASTQSGNMASVTITQPLTYNSQPGCNRYFVKGIIHTQNTGASDRYLDYGDGTCDNLAVETIDGNSQTIELE